TKIKQQLQQIEDIETNFVIDQHDVLIANLIMTKGNDITTEQEQVTEQAIQKLRQLQDTEPIRAVERALDGVSGYPIEIQVMGEDESLLENIINDLQKDIEQIDNIVGITTDIDQYEIIKEVQLNESNMRDTNMTQTELKEHILSLTTTKPISAIRTHDETIPIYLDSNHDN